MHCANTSGAIAMEVFVEQEQVLVFRLSIEICMVPVHWPVAVFIFPEDGDESFRQLA
jgi:hypothetical protein